MHIVLVYIHVKPDFRDEFIHASMENAKNSLLEPGIARFDFLQQGDDPDRFILYEAYRTPEDQQKHRETKHYLEWKDRVADMMAEPRQGIRHVNQFPPDQDW